MFRPPQALAARAQTIVRGPIIQNPDAVATTATIEWWTDVAGNSTVEYGLSTALGSSVTVAQAASCDVGSAGTCHVVPLTGLQPNTRYWYRLRAVNAGGSTGLQYFRPKPEGFEARALTIEGCTFLGSETPIAFVGVDGATVRFNTFYRPRKWFARILQETREEGFVPCRGGKYTDNLIAYRASEVSTPINVGTGTAPETFEFARNYWYCIDAPLRSLPQLPTPEKGAQGGVDPRFVDAEKGDLRLAEGSPAKAHGATASRAASSR